MVYQSSNSGKARRSTFMTRLGTDVAGNTVAMAAAALVPLVGMVGGAVDVSRFYMSTTRMQNACDAGALAARKAMGNDQFNGTHKSLANNFFDQNFPDGSFGVTNRSRTYTATTDGQVQGTASGTMPVSLMQVFGFGSFSLNVNCSADINISNTDIMFVLDVTGSMNCPDTGSCTNGNNNNVEASNARIKGLRTAVVTFYDTVEAATSNTAQVRYGILPYSNNINVGFSIPTQYLASSATYQSREPNWDTETTWEEIGFTLNGVSNRGGESRNGFIRTNQWNNVSSAAACSSYPLPPAYSDEFIDGSIQNSTVTLISESTSGNIRTRTYEATADFRRGVPVHKYNRRRDRCRAGHEIYEYEATANYTVVEEEKTTQEFDDWTYKAVSYDVSPFKTGAKVTTPTGNEGSDQEHTWTGCIEEADTVANSSFDPLPSGAKDLLINLKPSAAGEYWKPQLPQAVYRREINNNSNNYLPNLTHSGDERQPYYECPKPAERLADMTRDYLVDFLKASNGFDARGSTYHDIGMIWGARFISPNGIFSADNTSAPNGDAIARHIVFMTDGLLSTANEIYTPYGVEWWDRRITADGSGTQMADRHAKRFQAACKAARQENISVWVVAFGTTLTQNLIDCATPGRAFSASNSAQLETKFKEIAEKIAALRLTS